MKSKIDERAIQIFEAVVEKPSTEWEAAIDALCGSDLMLSDDVRRLLRADRNHGDVIERIRFDINDLIEETHQVPATIGRYKIEDEIGRGGMGVVFRARQDSPHRHVAVKLVHLGLAGSNIRQRFLNEVESHGRLDHPGIARIYDASIVQINGVEQPYIAMELIDGVPLGRFVTERRPDVAERIRLLVEICRIVEYAHRRGVIHRDLKPANILIEQRDGQAQPRVLDFGVSRLLKSDTTQTLITQPGQIIGTLAYSSPEQLNGNSAEIDTSTDTYSIAAVGFEMLTGELPIDVRHDTIATALHRIREEEPRRLRTGERALDADLDAIFAKALEKSKDRRYASVAEFRDDLQRYLSDKPIKARQRTTWYVVKKFARRRRGLVASVTLILLLFIGGSVGTLYGYYQSRQRLHQQVALSIELVDEIVKLQRVAGTSEVRLTTLENLRKRVESLLGELPQHQGLRKSYAEILESLSSIELEASRAEKSLALRQQALPIRAALADEIGDIDSLRRFAKCQILNGDVYRFLDQLDRAEAIYLEALDTQQRCLEIDPEHVGAYDDLLWSYSRIAKLVLVQHRDTGDRDRYAEALTWATEGYDKAIAFLDADRDDPKRHHAVLGFEAVLCNLYQVKNDTDSLFRVAMTRRKRAEALLENDPNNRWVRYELISALNSAADAKGRAVEIEAAIALQAESVELRRAQLDKADSYDVVVLGLQHSLVTLARWKTQLGDCDAAMKDIAEACRVLGDVVGPTSTRYFNQVDCLVWGGQLSANCGEMERSLEYFRSAMSAAEAYVLAQPDAWRPHYTLATLHLGDSLSGHQDLDAAHRAILKARALSPNKRQAVEKVLSRIERQLELK